jgi:hypothetical protein
VVLESSRVPTSSIRKRWIRLAIHDDDSAPLQIRGARGEVRSREIVFRASAAGDHRLYAGDATASAPRYDLAEILERAERAGAPKEASLGAIAPNPMFGKEERSASLPVTERYRGVIGVSLAVVLAALSLWALRMLRRGEGEVKDEPPA